ncbi:MAG: hypothetical protein CM15mP78_06290 [Candidatus Poseidoniales archaeon]|nr:MAG: hypothetical protein CM15mP78_06290 [Candidatus Poseidoniales archaeon]
MRHQPGSGAAPGFARPTGGSRGQHATEGGRLVIDLADTANADGYLGPSTPTFSGVSVITGGTVFAGSSQICPLTVTGRSPFPRR